MTPSIRTFLLINLLLSVTLITSLAIIGNLFLSHNDIQAQFDIQLKRTSSQVRALLTNSPSPATLRSIQNNLDHIKPHPLETQGPKKSNHSSLEYQIWKNKNLILRSHFATKTP